MRRELGDDYCAEANYEEIMAKAAYRGAADLCCYWFEKARALIETGKCRRAGLLATQGIRGGANRDVLKRIKNSGDIFFAESDREWVLAGANVHVSMVGFDIGSEESRILDGELVVNINANLTPGKLTPIRKHCRFAPMKIIRFYWCRSTLGTFAVIQKTWQFKLFA